MKYSPFGKGRIANFKQAFTSKEAFIEYAEAEKPDGERSNRVSDPLLKRAMS
jgi:hypothetical protein